MKEIEGVALRKKIDNLYETNVALRALLAEAREALKMIQEGCEEDMRLGILSGGIATYEAEARAVLAKLEKGWQVNRDNADNTPYFNWAINEIVQIPIKNNLHADRYDTDTEHVIHLWDDEGNSFDFRCPREAFV